MYPGGLAQNELLRSDNYATEEMTCRRYNTIVTDLILYWWLTIIDRQSPMPGRLIIQGLLHVISPYDVDVVKVINPQLQWLYFDILVAQTDSLYLLINLSDLESNTSWAVGLTHWTLWRLESEHQKQKPYCLVYPTSAWLIMIMSSYFARFLEQNLLRLTFRSSYIRRFQFNCSHLSLQVQEEAWILFVDRLKASLTD